MSSAVPLFISDKKSENPKNHEQHLTRRGLMPLDSEAHHQALADIATLWLGGDSSILEGARIMIIDENGILHVDGIGYQPAWGDESEVLNACLQRWHLEGSLPDESNDVSTEGLSLETDLSTQIETVASAINGKLVVDPERPILEASSLGVRLAPGTIVFDARTESSSERAFLAAVYEKETSSGSDPSVEVMADDEAVASALIPRKKLSSSKLDDSVRMYLNSLPDTELLSREDEVRLAKQIEAGGEKGEKATKEFIESNLRLVISIAQKYHGSRVPLIELIQAGNIGLMRAVEKFDWRKGFKFSTYATWWIKNNILKKLDEEKRGIRVPERINSIIVQLHRKEAELCAELGRQPTREEVLDRASVSYEDAEEAWRYEEGMVSLDDTLGDTDLARSDRVADDRERTEDAALKSTHARDLLRIIKSQLTPKEQAVVIMLYGLGGVGRRSLPEIDSELGLKHKVSDRIYARALEKLRNSQEARELFA